MTHRPHLQNGWRLHRVRCIPLDALNAFSGKLNNDKPYFDLLRYIRHSGEVKHIVQGKALASQVSTLRKSAEVGAAELESLQIQQNEDEEAGEELQSQLAEAEDEIAVLRLQAERAAILEVQSEISSRLVEDLQARACYQ